VVVDDAFHRTDIRRDLDILVVGPAGLGNGHCLPRGPLREPLDGIARADLMVDFQRGSPGGDETRALLRRFNRRAPIIGARKVPAGVFSHRSGEPADIRGLPVAVFSGLADPDGFRSSMLESGAMIAEIREYRDHHPYSRPDIEDVVGCALRNGAKAAVTTAKDAVKLDGWPEDALPLLVLRVRVVLDDPDAVLDGLLAGLGRRTAGRVSS
jgi:tetraacyldisaccharide 4'-kinase